MRRFFCLMALFASLLAFGETDIAKIRVLGTTDRNPLELVPGDAITFTIHAEADGKAIDEYYLKWVRSGDDGVKEEGLYKVDSTAPLKVTTTMSCAGFVRVNAQLCDEAGTIFMNQVTAWSKAPVEFDGGAGYSWHDLRNSATEPADFDAYWAAQKAKLAAVPLEVIEKVELQPLVEGFRFCKVKVACLGPRPVTGYLIIPDVPGKMAARAYYYGYNNRPISPSKEWFRPGFISFHVNAHGCELDASEEYYREFAKSIMSSGHSYGFDPEQNRVPENSYFYGMLMRVLRSLEFIRTLPEWDGKNLAACGYSQGGMQACWAAGLDSKVTYCRADIPWNGDIAGYTHGRNHGGWHLQHVPGLDYFDSAFHIKRAHCPLEIPRAGLGDYTCPPSGVSCIFNNAPWPKRITFVQGSQHGTVPPKAQRYVIQQGDFEVLKW